MTTEQIQKLRSLGKKHARIGMMPCTGLPNTYYEAYSQQIETLPVQQFETVDRLIDKFREASGRA